MSPRLSAIVSTDGIHRRNGDSVLALFAALALPWRTGLFGTTETAMGSAKWACYDCLRTLIDHSASPSWHGFRGSFPRHLLTGNAKPGHALGYGFSV